MKLFNQARAQAKIDRESCCLNKENYLVDGTGGDYREIFKQVKTAKEAGYDIAMIYVHVPVEESQKRNRARGESGSGRTLTTKTIERSWAAVNKNKEKYEELFGQNFFYAVNTLEASEKSINRIRSAVSNFLEV
jgi:predicted ABC-type ATPase